MSPPGDNGPLEAPRADPLGPARAPLLALHRILIDLERGEYEKLHGRVNPAGLYDLLLHHPSFAWMRPLSAAIARLDELPDTPESATARAEWLLAMRTLLRPDPEGGVFQRRYAECLARSPEALHAHAVVMRALPR
jgi:hypothetical protein